MACCGREDRTFDKPSQRGWFYLTKYCLIVALCLGVVALVYNFATIDLHAKAGVEAMLIVSVFWVLIGFIGVFTEQFKFVIIYALLMACAELTSFVFLVRSDAGPQIVVTFVLSVVVNLAAFSFAGMIWKNDHQNAVL